VLQGNVVVAIGHDARGAIDPLVLESSDPRFTDATLDAIREWRFEPPKNSPEVAEPSVPVVRFLFTTGAVSVMPLVASSREGSRRGVRADTPIELPNFSHLDHIPKALQNPAPEIPAATRERAATGTAVVKYFVDRDGRVRLPLVISATDPEFGKAAVAALREWRFEPPRIDGKPVIVLERHSFQFGP
jgi:TonB family protein